MDINTPFQPLNLKENFMKVPCNKITLGLLILLFSFSTSFGQLIISEYIEGAGFEKALELYNATGSDVNLNDYVVEICLNGDCIAAATVIPLSGTLCGECVFVMANDQATDIINSGETDFLSNSINFNGNDVILLKTFGLLVDALGQAQVNSDFAKDVVLRRKRSVRQGDTDPNDVEDLSQWDQFQFDDYSGLGSHQADDLFISEYVEGSGANQAIEIYNPTSTEVSLGNYSIWIFFDGAVSTSNIVSLTGDIGAGGVHVVANASSIDIAAPNQQSTTLTFDGNDVVVLYNGDLPIDVVGQVGNASVFAMDKTLVRKPTVDEGDPDGTDAFDPNEEWIEFGIDVFNNLGSHNFDADGDSFGNVDDCDDNDPETYPGAPEQNDGKDNDCDTIVDNDIDLIIMTDGSISACDATFLDPGGYENFGPNLDVIMTIAPEELGDLVVISFESFEIGNTFDFLKIYDGPGVTSPLLADLTGSDLPSDYTSSANGGELTFHFTSSATPFQPGWEATITCIPSNFPANPPQNFQFSNIGDDELDLFWEMPIDNGYPLTSFELAIKNEGNETVEELEPTATMESLNDLTPLSKYTLKLRAENENGFSDFTNEIWAYPGQDIFVDDDFTVSENIIVDENGYLPYDNGVNKTMVLLPECTGGKVSIEFLTFETEENFDVLTVHNGNGVANPILGEFSGNALPPALESTAVDGALTLTFVTDGSVFKAGFEIRAMVDNLTTYYLDSDNDGLGDLKEPLKACSQPAGYVENSDDCDDSDNGVGVGDTYYEDADGDGYGGGDALVACEQPEGYSDNNFDCNDLDADINPDTKWYADEDGDGYGNPNNFSIACIQPADHVLNDLDCDSGNADINPEGIDVAGTAVDANCDGMYLWFKDSDGDGYAGTSTVSSVNSSPDAENGEFEQSLDCNDEDADINPETKWYADEDGDGFGNPGNFDTGCVQPPDHVANNLDCDSGNASVYPGAPALPDGLDNDCDGEIDKAPQTITIEPIADRNDGDGDVEVIASSTSGLDLEFDIEGPADINNNILTFFGVGSIKVIANQPGDGLYLPAEEASISFCINPAPTISVADEPSSTLILESNYGSGNQWYLNGSAIDDAGNQLYDVSEVGTYTVQVSIDGCTGVSEPFEAIVTATRSIGESSFTLFPNPVVDKLYVDITEFKGDGKADVYLLNMNGTILKAERVLIGNKSFSWQYDVSEIPTGIYFIIVKSGDIIINERFTKQ